MRADRKPISSRIRPRFASGLSALALALGSSGCFLLPNSATSVAPAETSTTSNVQNDSTTEISPTGPTYNVTGKITYDQVPADPGYGLRYSQATVRPARRIRIQAIDTSSGSVISETRTNDRGEYTLAVPVNSRIRVRALARSSVSAYLADSIGADACEGASWDVRVVDNTTSPRSQFAMDSPLSYRSAATDVDLHAGVEWSSGRYQDRAGAPYALLDLMISEIELICGAEPAAQMPLLYVNWSEENTNAYNSSLSRAANLLAGQISTSHYTQESGASQIYVLGKEDVDTDEFDAHVITHEFGHFLEDRLYRSDSIGGDHSSTDALDPRVAFSEGFGNAVSAMTLEDPVYVDTLGTGQADAFWLEIDHAPRALDGVFSEASVQYFLWTLFDARDPAEAKGSFDRIHAVLKNHQKTTPAFTTLQSFASYYNMVYGADADGFRTLWTGAMDQPYHALCAGACSGTGDIADPFDQDNDLGTHYATTRKYKPLSSGSSYSAEFWRLYRSLSSGTNTATDHDRAVIAGYSYTYNKFGTVRWYRYAGQGATVTITANNLRGGHSCTQDVLDMVAYGPNGTQLDWDESVSGSSAGCPYVRFAAEAGKTYLIAVHAVDVDITGWDMQVSP